MTIGLIDTGFLLAVFDQRDEHHVEAFAFVDLLAQDDCIILPIVLVEATYILQRYARQDVRPQFLSSVNKRRFPLDNIDYSDLERSTELLVRYPRLDFVDTCLIAYAERNNIQAICTYDLRDFSMVKPRHVDSFILLPSQFDRLWG